jgi:hypothetical protein
VNVPRRAPTAGLVVLATSIATLAASATAFAAAPEVLSEGVSAITPFEAHLEATVNAGEESTECSFEYGKITVSEHEVACEQGATIEGGEQGVGVAITGLSGKTTYHYEVLVKNTEGHAEGSGEFETLTPEKPTVESESASGVGSTAATLSAQVDPDYQSTTYTFDYATNEALTGATVVHDTSPLEGGPEQTASVPTGVLVAGETYYYRVVAENETSKKEGLPVEGPVQSFATTPEPITETPTSITGTSATFQGRLTLSGTPASYAFEYNEGASCSGEGASMTPTSEVKSGTPETTLTSSVPSSEDPSLLHPNTEYTVCLVLSNASGSSGAYQAGNPVSFTTPTALPVITPGSLTATGAGVAGIRLEAKIDPYLQETTYSFEYATSQAALEDNEGTRVDGATALLAAELKELPASVQVPAPQPGVTYFYRATAENESTVIEGTPVISGEIKTYALPIVTLAPAENIARTTATVTGTVNPQGTETTYHFAHITQAAYEKALAGDEEEKTDPFSHGEATETASAGTEPQEVPVTQIAGLRPGETYVYALIATSAIGSETSEPRTLTTLTATPPGALTGPAAQITASSAVLTGAVTTNGLQTTYAFELETEPGAYGPPTGQGTVGGDTTQTVTTTITGLAPGVTYRYRLRTSNLDGTVTGETQTFTTLNLPYRLTITPAPTGIPAPPTTETPTEKPSTPPPKHLTKTQKLHKALAACKKDHNKTKRVRCEKTAKKKYGPPTKKHKTTK